MKALKSDWSERGAHQAVKSWLSLGTSSQFHIRAVICQNDAMAMGAKKAFASVSDADRERWRHIPFTGCDGVTKTGQEWVRRGELRATVIIPPMAGLALEMLVKAAGTGSMPPEKTLWAPRSFPALAEISARSVGA